jgi:hypothetical protein
MPRAITNIHDVDFESRHCGLLAYLILRSTFVCDTYISIVNYGYHSYVHNVGLLQSEIGMIHGQNFRFQYLRPQS